MKVLYLDICGLLVTVVSEPRLKQIWIYSFVVLHLFIFTIITYCYNIAVCKMYLTSKMCNYLYVLFIFSVIHLIYDLLMKDLYTSFQLMFVRDTSFAINYTCKMTMCFITLSFGRKSQVYVIKVAQRLCCCSQHLLAKTNVLLLL